MPRLLLAVVLIMFFVDLSVHAVSRSLAHLQVIRVENSLQQWNDAGQVSSSQAMIDALDAIERAIHLHTDNPYQLTLKAGLLEWRGFSLREGDAAQADFRQALNLQRRAAALRPLWPETWAEMAGLKLRLNQLDKELDFFLAQADKTGPYTPLVHTTMTRAGFTQLAHYPFRTVPLLQQHLLRGLIDPRTTREVKELVYQYKQEKMTCRWLAQADEPKPKVGFCA